MNSLYTCKGGTLAPRDPEKGLCPKPSVISYRHTIRQINDGTCNCKEDKERMAKEYKAQLDQKDAEIIALVNRIADKETEIDQLQTKIASIESPKIILHTLTPKHEHFDPTNQNLWDRMEKTLNSTVVSTFSLGDLSSPQFTNRSHRYQIQNTEAEMQDCFKKTNSLMNDIEGIMKKKRKYEFYNRSHVKSPIIQEIDTMQEKEQDQTQEISIEDTFCRPMSEYNDEQSLDMTTFESVQNFGHSSQEAFYQKLIKDSIQLKNTILQMRQESSQEIRELEEYYQKQLKISYEELEKERSKNGFIEMTKNRLNRITNKGRQALADLDQNEGFNWDVGDRILLKRSILYEENDDCF